MILGLRSKFAVVAFLAVLLVGNACDRKSAPPSGNPASPTATMHDLTLERVRRTGVVRVGFSGYPPYLQQQPGSTEPTGFSADLIRRIIEIWGRKVQIEWVETNWQRVKVDILAGKFDVFVEPVFQTIARASEVGASRPYAFFGYGIPLIRSDEKRFSSIDDLNQPGVTIAVTQGISSHDFAIRRLTKATIKPIPESLEQPLTEVLLGKTDAAVADETTIRRFVEANKGRVKALALDNPPVYVAAGFMIPQGDYTWAEFLNISLQFLETSGETQALAAKYGVPFFPISSAAIERQKR